VSDESTETSGFEPTVIENATLGLSQLDKDLVDEAIRQGLITQVQGQMVLESVVTSESPEGGTETVALMVDRGLIPKEKAEELLDSLTEEFVPGYRLGRELGRGAMGVVYEATQKKLGRKVALKVVNPALSQNADYVKRFKREAQTLAKLNHPNIVQLYDFGEANGRIFLALEFVEGEDVTSYMEREGRVDEKLAIRIVRDVALGLGHGHLSSVIHRDVKPANLLLLREAEGGEYTTKITDFGLAREQEHKGDGELTQEGTILGTPAYMAPEQTEGVAACHKCDIYALGATLYHMLTGTVPFQASSVVSILLKKQTERLENPQIKAPELSSQAVRLLDRMLSKTPSERYQDYTSLLADVELVLQGQEPGAEPLPEEHSSLQLSALVQTQAVKVPSGRQEVPGESGSLLPVVGVIALVLILIGAYIGLKGTTPSPSPSPSQSVVVQSSRSANQLLDDRLKALKEMPPATVASQLDALTTARDMIQALPEGERDLFKLRFEGLVSTAASASKDKALEALSKAWRAGDYPRLAELIGARAKLLAFTGQELVEEFATYAKRSAAAEKDGAGAAERALWSEIEAGWNKSPRDISGLLRQLDEMRDYNAFSPEAETAAKRVLELENSAPVVELIPVPSDAVISIDGEEQAPGAFKARLAAGKHVITAAAEGYRPYERALDLKGRLAEQLHLAPLRKQALKVDPNLRVKGRRKPVLNPRSQSWDQRWKREEGGEWAMRPREIPTGLDGTGSRLGASVITHQEFAPLCLAKIKAAGAKGWTLTWRMFPFQGTTKKDKRDVPNPISEEQVRSAAAELRVLKSEAGELAVGFDHGQVYLGLRKADGLYHRWTESYAGAPPEFFRVSWDGDVAEVSVKDSQAAPWRFFHSVRLQGASEQTLSLAVLDGRVLFTDLNAPLALVPE
jgi:eukaryotic-like serine/threonine-protein kinase